MTNAIALSPSTFTEEWRPILGYEEAYSVSSLGRILSKPRRGRKGGLRKTKIGKNGYPIVVLSRDNVSKTYAIHSLMAVAFLGPRPEGAVVRHLDGDRLNSRIGNIAWGTPHENTMDRVAHGRDRNAIKTHCPQGHPYDEANTYTSPSRPTQRRCRTCLYGRVYARAAAINAARES